MPCDKAGTSKAGKATSKSFAVPIPTRRNLGPGFRSPPPSLP